MGTFVTYTKIGVGTTSVTESVPADADEFTDERAPALVHCVATTSGTCVTGFHRLCSGTECVYADGVLAG